MAAAAAPVRRGRKDPSLLVQVKPEETTGPETVLVTGRPLRVGKHLFPIGVEVPGAEHYPRLEAWLSSRYIKRIPATEEHIKHDDYVEWLQLEEIDLQDFLAWKRSDATDEDEQPLSLEDFLAQLEVERIEAEAEAEEPEQPKE